MTGKSQQTPANDTSTGTPAQAKADTTPKFTRGPAAATKAKAATGQPAATSPKDHTIGSAAAGRKHRKTPPDQNKNSDPANMPARQASLAGNKSAATVLAARPASAATQAASVRDDGDGDDDATATPDVAAGGDTSLAALAPPIPASTLHGQQGNDDSGDGQTGASSPLSQPNPPAGNSIAGGNPPASAQNPGQGGGDKDGDGTVAAGDQIKSKPAADGSSNPQTIADAAAAASQADLADAAQKSGSGDSTGDSAEKKTGPAGADLKSESGKSKSRDKSDSDPSASADVLASALAMSPPASSQPSPATGDDDAAPADTQKASAATGPASSLPVAAQAPQAQTPADGKTPADPGSNQIPVAAPEPGDKKDQSGKAPSQADSSSAATQGNAIEALATAMTGGQGAAATPAADSKATNQSGDTQPAGPGHDGGDKPAHVTQSVAAPQPSLPAQIQPAVTQQLNVSSQATPPVTAGPSIPGANPSGIATSVHIASAAANAVPNLDVLAVSVAARSLSGAKQFDIRLDPPELGSVQVRLSIDASGKTQAHMTADQPQTLTLLQKDAPSLAQALRDAGLNVSQNGLNFSLRGQDRQDDARNGGAPSRRTSLSATQIIAATPAPAALSRAGAASQARVDIHV